MPAYDRNVSAPPAKVAGDGAGDEERHRERVHRRHERSHPRVDDTGREKQLKGIRWNPEQVEKKRHGGGEAAEEGYEPGECELRIARERHRRVCEPSREEDETQGEELSGVREVEGGRHDDLRQPAWLLVAGTQPAKKSVAGLHERRQHDEEVAGDGGGDERVARLAEYVSESNGGERRDQSREHPQAEQEGHCDVRHEVDLQPAQLLQTKRSRRVGRDREQSIRSQAGHEAGSRRDRVFGDLQDIEQTLPAFDADQGYAQNEREQDDGRHDVVREGIEWVRGNVQVDEVESGSALDEARAEKRGVLNVRKRQGDQERE